jgi:hypothetical protein
MNLDILLFLVLYISLFMNFEGFCCFGINDYLRMGKNIDKFAGVSKIDLLFCSVL